MQLPSGLRFAGLLGSASARGKLFHGPTKLEIRVGDHEITQIDQSSDKGLGFPENFGMR